MAAKRRTRKTARSSRKTGRLTPKALIRQAPILAVLAVVLLGTAFTLLDHFGILSYQDITAMLQLDDKIPTPTGELSVHYFDVGQGDCQIIQSGDCTVLIDAGEAENGSQICSYLKSLGVTRLDYVIGTHPHADHIGGMAEVIRSMDVGTVILSKVRENLTPTTKTYLGLLQTIQEKGLKITQAKPGDQYDLGGVSTLTLLGPLTEEGDSLNDYSVVCRLTHGQNTFLFTGDAENSEEKDILATGKRVSADVLKVGHHGSSTSSTQAFLDAVDPEYCVIQVGEGNSYHHPNAGTMKRLQQFTKNIYRNDLLGTVVCSSDGQNYSFQFEKAVS